MQTIDIITTQNVTIQYELASLRDRFIGFIIDLVIIVLYLVGMLLVVLPLFNVKYNSIIADLVVLPGMFLYTFLFETLLNGQTPGKIIIKTKVVKLNGKEPNVSDYLIRWMFRLPDIWLSLGTLGALLISSTQRNQRLGCLLSDTSIIKLNSQVHLTLDDILNINSVENYQPTFSNLQTLFTDDDFLTIKKAINRFNKYPNMAHAQVINDLCMNVSDRLGLTSPIENRMEFLKTLLRDYIALTR